MSNENKLQEALHTVAEHYADLLQDYRTDFKEDETDEQLKGMIARTDLVLSDLEMKMTWE